MNEVKKFFSNKIFGSYFAFCFENEQVVNKLKLKATYTMCGIVGVFDLKSDMATIMVLRLWAASETDDLSSSAPVKEIGFPWEALA